MPQPPADRRLILFGRYPVPGQTKTRLIPELGPLGAAELQRYLTERTLATLKRSYLAPVDFLCDGGSRQQVRRWLAGRKVRYQIQPAGTLGARMQEAMRLAFAKGAQQVVLVGTDVPDLTTGHITRSFAALTDHDVVLGPSDDGGYWLVGSRKMVPIFDDIAWSSPDVLSRTLENCRRRNLSTALLTALNDIDTAEDLYSWPGGKRFQRPYLTVVIPTLEESGNIEKALTQVSGPDMEAVVCDGGSRDSTASLARQAGVQVVHAPGGRAVQQNAGAGMARGRVLLFLHADTRLPQNFGSQIFEQLMDPRVVLGAFRFKTDLQKKAMRLIERGANLRSAVLKMPYGDQALFLRRRTFNHVGGFPTVPIAEDLFLVRRLNRLGRIVVAPGEAVTSGRRWQNLGIFRTTLINNLIAAGCLAGIAPERLAPLYRWNVKRSQYHAPDSDS